MKKILVCKCCGSTDLKWDDRKIINTDVEQGRLRTSDVDVQFFLGCNQCSETLYVASAAAVTNMLNNIHRGFNEKATVEQNDR